MRSFLFNRTKTIQTFFLGLVFVLTFSFVNFAQTKSPTVNLPKVTQIDAIGLKKALTPNGKPLLVNFWATWCDPCREEFPDLVKINAEYKGKIDFITISLDDLAEINRDVPKFLSEQKAEMPAYLLKVADESTVISSISKDYSGGLPFTILYNEKGEIAYFRQGKIKTDIVKTEIDKLLPQSPTLSSGESIFFLPERKEDYESGMADARTDISNGILVVHTSGRGTDSFYRQILQEKYGIVTKRTSCLVTSQTRAYIRGYNEVSKAEIKKRFGEDVFEKVEKEAKETAKANAANVDELILTVNRKN